MLIGLSRNDVQSARSARQEGIIVGLCYEKRARGYSIRAQKIVSRLCIGLTISKCMYMRPQRIEVLVQVVICRATLPRFYALLKS